jgi:hypothetical protein
LFKLTLKEPEEEKRPLEISNGRMLKRIEVIKDGGRSKDNHVHG